jgi:hypothetical protein
MGTSGRRQTLEMVTEGSTMRPSRWMTGLALVVLMLSLGPDSSMGAGAKARRFATLDEAASSLVDAVRSNDQKALLAILGPEGQTLVSSGDPVADRQAREKFVASYDKAHRLEGAGGKVTLYVGEDDFPLPIPLVPDGYQWRFDTRAGKEEMLNRRIGQNELAAIQTCLAYVDSQMDYYSEDRNADGLREYAQRFASTPGKRDGLYWPTKPGEKASPLGPLVVRAQSQGYRKVGSKPVPYHGYYYRILTAQGPDAPGGAYDYLAHGRMIGGFALVAFPAQYGVSGVMTLLVNQDGVVYQKDLGPNTASAAAAIKTFNPDKTWKKV